MSSLGAKLSSLRYKGIITDKDYQRLKKALNVVDGLQDAIDEIEQSKYLAYGQLKGTTNYLADGLDMSLDIIRKHTKVGDTE